MFVRSQRITLALLSTGLILVALALLTAGFAPTVSAQQKPNSGARPLAASDVTIPGAPLQIALRPSGAYGVYRNNVQQFFGGYAEGVYLWINGQVWGPEQVPAGLPVNSYTPISLNITGNGSSNNPYVATTVLGVGDTGRILTQKVTYVNGQEFLRNDFSLCLSQTAPAAPAGAAPEIHMFHAADLYTGNNDSGYGYYDPATGSVGGYTQDRSLYQIFTPITRASHYEENGYSTIWAHIGSTSGLGSGFIDTYLPDTTVDNGAGLEWIFGANDCVTISDYISFAGTPTLPTPGTPGPTVEPTASPTPGRTRPQPADIHGSLKQDADRAVAPGDMFTYTVTLKNTGPGEGNDTTARLMFDPNVVQVRDFHSTAGDVFVTGVQTNSLSIGFHNMGNQESESGYVLFSVKSDATVGATFSARAELQWDDALHRNGLSDIVISTVGPTRDAGMHGLQRSLIVSSSDPVADGTTVGFAADFYGSEEPVSFWLNKPDGTVGGIDRIVRTSQVGILGVSIDTTDLAPGTYSLVAHGLNTGMEGIGIFTVR